VLSHQSKGEDVKEMHAPALGLIESVQGKSASYHTDEHEQASVSLLELETVA
jgi:hypothetical protein